MDYKEKYNEALQRAKSIYRDAKSEHYTHTDWLENIFPELKESEDERIRKAIFQALSKKDAREVLLANGLQVSEALAWLEKQGSQNLANSAKTCKDEPKFKVGDWVIDKQDIVHQIANVVENVTNHTYGYDIVGGGYFNDNAEGVRLWTIQDAKDGDVLATQDYILIFKEFLKNDGGISYCHYDFGAVNPQFIWLEDKNWYFGKEAIIHPATKEQRNLLFQKMKEAGYEWDAEKKELKKIKQNHAWSEEDEEMLNNIIHLFRTAYTKTDGIDEKVEFLKALKSRVQPQPKSDWNNKDEISFNRLMAICADGRVRKSSVFSEKEIKDLMDWLESIKKRVQPQWKPSDEQMSQLECVATQNKDNILGKELITLFNDLKKLKGE